MLCDQSSCVFETLYLQFYSSVSTHLHWQSLRSYSLFTFETSKGLSKSVGIDGECILV